MNSQAAKMWLGENSQFKEKSVLKNERGFSSIELMVVSVVIGALALATMTTLRYARPIVEVRSAQNAMVLIATEDAKAKFPVEVTITDLINHGAMVSDYTIESYARTGTPAGKDYELELKTEDAVLFCVTMSTLVRAACD